MRKIISYVILILLLQTNLQIGEIYANETLKLESEKEKSVEFLNKVETVLERATEKIGNNIRDEEIKEKLEEKKEEIKETLEEAKKEIKEQDNKKEIKQIALETRKKVVLKVVNAISKESSLKEGIDETVASTKQEKAEALETIQESLEEGAKYSFIIKTRQTRKKVEKLFKMFEQDTQVNYLYSDKKEKYYEITVPKDSIFSKEMLGELENGNMPESFLSIKIVQPEVYRINQKINQKTTTPTQEEINKQLKKENLDKTWGVKKYKPESYLKDLKTKSEKYKKTKKRKIQVAVIDTGIDYNHPDLKGRTSKGKDFVNKDEDGYDDHGHGTHVAGTIGASLNGSGIMGVNPYVELVPLKICNKRGYCPSYAVIKSLEYIKDSDIDLVNMSLGGRGDTKTSAICGGIETLTKAGKIVVSASGNSNVDTKTFIPGGCKDSITVGALDKNNTRASFSNYGNKVDTSAPGVGIYSTFPENRYKELSGTSMATPHVVGLLSILKTYKPSLTTKQAKKLLKENSLEVLTQTNKPVGNFTNLEQIFLSFDIKKKEIIEENNQKESEEKVVEEELKDELLPEEKDDAILVDNIDLVENQKALEKDDSFNLAKLKKPKINSVLIDFLNSGENLEIKDLENLETKIEKLDLKLEPKKDFSDFSGSRYFDGNGEVKKEDLEINNLDYNGEKFKGILVGEDFDYMNLPAEKPNDTEEIEIEELKEAEIKEEPKEIYIDGAEKGVELNSLRDKNFEKLEIKNHDSLEIPNEEILEGEKIEVEVVDKIENGYDTNGLEINNVDNKTNKKSIKDKEYSIFDIENMSSIKLGGEKEVIYEEDEKTKLEESFGILNSTTPKKVEEINHEFKNLKDNDKYEVYIDYRRNRYNMNNTHRGVLNSNGVETKMIDNAVVIKGIENYNYKKKSNPKKFYGKLKTTLAGTNRGRGQYGYSAIMGKDKQPILKLSIPTSQLWGTNYLKQLRKNFCSISKEIDEYECGEMTNDPGKYIEFLYKKNNGKYSQIRHKLPDYLRGEYIFDYEADFETKRLKVLIKQEDGKQLEELNISFESLSDFKDIDFSNFHYFNRTLTTNGYNHKFSPREIGVIFEDTKKDTKEDNLDNKKDEIGNSSNPEIFLESINTQANKITRHNEKNLKIKINGLSNIEKTNDFNYFYSLDGENYKEIDGKYEETVNGKKHILKNGVEISSVEDDNTKNNNLEDQNYSLFDIENMSSIKQGGEKEVIYEEDEKTKLEESFGILNSSIPKKVEEIRHEFKDLKDESNYEVYIDYGGRKYNMNNTHRGVLNSNGVETKMIDNSIVIKGRENYNYKKRSNPKKFYGKLKTTLSNVDKGRGQYGYSAIMGEDKQPIIRFMVYGNQLRGSNYRLNKGARFCSLTNNLDESDCLDTRIKVGNYIKFLYRKSNGKYSLLMRELPSYLRGEYIFEYEADFETKRLKVLIKQEDGKQLEELNISFESLSDFKDIDFSNFHYFNRTLTTNGYNHKFSPREIGISFEKVNEGEDQGLEKPNQFKSFSKKLELDLSSIPDGDVNIYLKSSYGLTESNILYSNLEKDTNPLEAPTNFTLSNLDYYKVRYNWEDNSKGENNEEKYVLKDSNNNILVDNLSSNSITYTETGLKSSSNYSRKICAVFGEYERCSELLTFRTKDGPEIIERDIYTNVGEYFSIKGWTRLYKYSYTKAGMVDIVMNRSHIIIYPRQTGYLEIYLKDVNGKHHYTLKLNIKEPPKAKEYKTELIKGHTTIFHLPENIDNYDLTSKGSAGLEVLKHGNSLKIRSNAREGETTLYLKDKDGYKWTRYKLKIKVKVPEINYSLYETDYIRVWYNDNYNYSSENRNIAYQRRYSIRAYDHPRRKYEAIYGNSVGTTKIKVSHYKYGLDEIWNITVNPKPKPKTLECEIEIGEECKFYIRSSNNYYSESRGGVIEIDARRGGIELEGLKSGEAIVYVKSYTGNYITHILKIKVKPKPPRIYTCETPIGRYCESHKQKIYDGYTFSTTNPKLISLERERIWNRDGRTDYENFKIKGEIEGETEVYIYHHGDLISIVKTKVLPAVKEIRLKDSIVKIKEGERYTSQVLEGGGDYHNGDYDKELIYFDVDRDGEIYIRGKKHGRTWARIEDKYDQVEDIKVIVKDTRLIIGGYEKELEQGKKYLVPIYESNGDVVITKTNTNVLVYKRYTSNPVNYYETNYLEIITKKSGRSVIGLRDSEGNLGRIVLRVGGSTSPEPSPEEEGEENSEGNEDNEDSNGRDLGSENLDEIEKELLDELEKLFKEFTQLGVNTNSLEINSWEYSFSCELNNSSLKYYKPYNAICVENDRYNAWQCKTGYKPIGKDGGYTCINNEYYKNQKNIEAIKLKIDQNIEEIKKYSLQKTPLEKYKKVNDLINNLRKLQNEFHIKYYHKNNTKGFLNQIIDYYIGKLDILHKQYTKGLNEYKAKLEIKILKIKLEREQIQKESQGAKGKLAGYEQALKDYAEGYSDLLNYEDYGEILKGLGNVLSNPIDSVGKINESYSELYDLYEKRDEIFANLDDYNKAYYTMYIETTVGLELIPVKIDKLTKFNVKGSFKSLTNAKNISKIKWSTVKNPDLSKVKNEKLKRVLEKDYKITSKIGNKSTADAIRYTKATGNLVGEHKPSDHIKKGNEILNGIQKRFNANDLSEYDKKIATDIFNDITSALNGK